MSIPSILCCFFVHRHCSISTMKLTYPYHKDTGNHVSASLSKYVEINLKFLLRNIKNVFPCVVLLHLFYICQLTFKNLVSYIQDGRTTTLQMVHFIYIFSTNISTEYFKHAAHSPFFSSKCHLFHNATFFGSCIIHILHTGCAKI